jgi:hypothetical protein
MARRSYITMIRHDCRAIQRLRDGQGGRALQQFHQCTGRVRVEMLDDDKSEAGSRRDVLKKLCKRLKSSGRSAHAHDAAQAIHYIAHKENPVLRTSIQLQFWSRGVSTTK